MTLRDKDLTVQEIITMISSNASAIVTEDLANNLVFEHKVFGTSKRFTLGSSATTYIIIDPTASPSDFVILLPPFFSAFGAGPINIDVYAGPTFTPGTDWSPVDRNFDTPVTPGTKIYNNATVTDEGVKLPTEFVILSNGTAATTTTGGETKDDLVINLDKNVIYMFKLVNTEANPASCVFAASIFEF